jgi:hypothetical protein
MAHKMPHTTGDSTKYRAEVHLPAVDAYLAGDWQKINNAGCPCLIGFSIYIKISRRTLNNWAEKFPEWKEKFDYLKDQCEHSLFQGALTGALKEKMAALGLSHNYGYAEKKVVDNQSSDGSMSPKATIDTSLLDDASLKAIMAAVIKSDT